MNRNGVGARLRKSTWICLLALSFILVDALGPRAQDGDIVPVVRLGSAKIEIGAQGSISVILESAPKGLQLYDITVSLKTSGIARICCARGGTIAGVFFQVIDQTDTSIEIRALDQFHMIESDAQNVTLAVVGVVGVKAGRTEVVATINVFMDDTGAVIAFEGNPGQIEVTLPPIGDSRNPPLDLDGDGLFEDLNGDGVLGPEDVAFFSVHFQDSIVQSLSEYFDFNRDRIVNFDDVEALVGLVEQAHPTLAIIGLEEKGTGSGQQVSQNFLLIKAPLGLRRYHVILSVVNARVIQIKDIRSGAIDQRFFQILRQGPDAIEFRAVDFLDQIRPGATEMVLALIILEGGRRGDSLIQLEIKDMADDRGESIIPLVLPGLVQVTLSPLEASLRPPQDLDGDGLFEDVDGDGQLTFNDPITLAFHLNDAVVQLNADLFDFDRDGDADYDDTIALVNRLL